jgi:hypothetical protein
MHIVIIHPERRYVKANIAIEAAGKVKKFFAVRRCIQLEKPRRR